MLTKLLILFIIPFFSASCSKTDKLECRPVRNIDIPFLASGNRLNIIQESGVPLKYNYKTHCNVNKNIIASCYPSKVTGVSRTELDSVGEAIIGLYVRPSKMNGFSRSCIALNIFIQNG